MNRLQGKGHHCHRCRAGVGSGDDRAHGGLDDLDAANANPASLRPLGSVGVPDDIAWGVVHLAADDSAFVIGSELVIDRGYTTH